MKGSVDDLLHLAELARERKAYVEARVYLKIAMMRAVARPEPYYWLGHVCRYCLAGRFPYECNVESRRFRRSSAPRAGSKFWLASSAKE
jgi:hypothetical protein